MWITLVVYSTRRRAKIEGVGHEEFSKYVWLGVHKETIAVSVAEVSGGEVVNSDLKLIQFFDKQRFKTDTPPSFS